MLLLLSYLFPVLISQAGDLSNEVFLLLLERRSVRQIKVCSLNSMAFLLGRELLTVPSVKLLELLSLLSKFSCELVKSHLLFFVPFLLPLRELLSHLFLNFAPLDQFLVVSSFLLFNLFDVDTLSLMYQFLLLLNLYHQLTDLGLKTQLETLLHLSVLLDRCRRLGEHILELLSGTFMLADKTLDLCYVLL